MVFLAADFALEVRQGHGRDHVNFYRILREEDGLPIPSKRRKKVKSETPIPPEKVQFPTPPEPEKVQSESSKPLTALGNVLAKVVETKERKEKEDASVSLSPQDDAAAPEDAAISPEVMRKFGLRYNVADWPPARCAD